MRDLPGKIFRKIKYKADQQGIMNRYLREGGGWDDHLRRCRRYIIDALKVSQQKRVTILGSGWLLDIPLEEIREMADEVLLVDIIHPSQIRKKVSEMDNVKLVEDDITGGVAEIIATGPKSEAVANIPVYKPSFDPGMILSVNILTQLDGLLDVHLRKISGGDKAKERRVRKRIQEAHLEMLDRYPSLLITEYREHITGRDNFKSSNSLLYCDLPAGRDQQYWKWKFDTTGSYYRKMEVIFDVVAVRLFK